MQRFQKVLCENPRGLVVRNVGSHTGWLETQAGSAASGRLLALSEPQFLCWKVEMMPLCSSQGHLEDQRL